MLRMREAEAPPRALHVASSFGDSPDDAAYAHPTRERDRVSGPPLGPVGVIMVRGSLRF